mgnify:CR=1 FL=1
MDKNVLEQYSSIKNEISDLERMIAKSNRQIKKYEKKIVSDTVTGSRDDLTIGPIKITGIAQQRIDRENELNDKRVQKMEKFKKKLEKMSTEVEEYIQEIPDSEIRRIARLRYLDDLTWQQVAIRMGQGYTKDCCRVKLDRFLEK